MLTGDLIVPPVSEGGRVLLLMEHGELQRPQNVNDSCLGERKRFAQTSLPARPPVFACRPAGRLSVAPWHPGQQHLALAARLSAQWHSV